MASAAPTWSAQAPGGWQEIGVGQVVTGAGANTGGVALRAATADLYRIPPPGSIWCSKIRMTSGTASYELWSGFASSTGRVQAADATQFIGIRSDGANLYGVVKNGAASETTVDLGYDCEAVWRTFGFEVAGDTTAPEVQFFQLDELGTSRFAWDRTDIGDPITATMPSTSLFSCAIGLVTTTASARTAQIDHWCLAGRTERG